MIDQSHCIEPKVPAMIQSVLNIQTAYAKALLIDRQALAAAQRAGDVLGANRLVQEAFEQDVTGLMQEVRVELGGSADPMGAYLASGHETAKLGRGYGQGWN